MNTTELKPTKVRTVPTETEHFRYDCHRPEHDELIVLIVWGAPRKRGPKL